MVKVAHLSDIHIKNHKYHEEYKLVFDDLYSKLKVDKPDFIVLVGDIAHVKLSFSPDFLYITSEFFKNLSNIAPLYIIAGNHDLNLYNIKKLDTITPIVKALNLPNIHFFKFSTFDIPVHDNVFLNVFSILDEHAWRMPSNLDSVNIVLFHDEIDGVITRNDLNQNIKKVDIFKGYDYAMLGHIHFPNQIMDIDGRCRYSGALVQQNFGETIEKGYLLWTILDKDTFDVQFRQLINPFPFITLHLNKNGLISNEDQIVDNAKIRIIYPDTIYQNDLSNVVKELKSKYSPQNIVLIKSDNDCNIIINDNEKNNFLVNNIRDVESQEELIKRYLLKFEINSDTFNRIFKLNKKYNELVEQTEEVTRNIHWRLESLEWDNLFNYGKNNFINFSKFKGLVGILAKNWHGKTSVIENILYTIFNNTSKNNRKNLHIINQNKKRARGKVEIAINEEKYVIERISEKYFKYIKSNDEEAKTSVDFNKIDSNGNVISYNGISRSETDKTIRKLLGTLEDFKLTSMTPQFNFLEFLEEGPTKRKEILAKFLDLEIFDKKFKIAKEESLKYKMFLKDNESTDYNTDISKIQKTIKNEQNCISNHQKKLDDIKFTLEQKQQNLSEIYVKIGLIPGEILDIKELHIAHGSKLKKCESLNDEIEIITKKKIFLEQEINNLEKIINKTDFEKIKIDLNEYTTKKNNLELLGNDIKSIEDDLKNQNEKIGFYKDIPCNFQYTTCKFIKNAKEVLDNIKSYYKTLDVFKQQRETISNELAEIDFEQLELRFTQYRENIEKNKLHSIDFEKMKLILDKKKIERKICENEIIEIKEKIEQSNKNLKLVQELDNLNIEEANLKNEISTLSNNAKELENAIILIHRSHGINEEKLNNLESQKKKNEKYAEKYKAYELLMRCMHYNGIPHEIISKKLPMINNEISKILCNIVDFQIFLKAEDKKLDIFIKHPKYESRPLSTGSGSEKTIAAMAIRLALLNASNMPKSNFLIMDEPGTSLDSSNIEGFIQVLNFLTAQYDFIILISHMDSLKDVVGHIIEIEQDQNGYAHIYSK